MRHRHRHRRRNVEGRFFTYIRERLEGFEARPESEGGALSGGGRRVSRILRAVFQGGDAGRGDCPGGAAGLRGAGEIYGRGALQKDIANLKAAAKAAGSAKSMCSCRRRRLRAWEKTNITKATKNIFRRWPGAEPRIQGDRRGGIFGAGGRPVLIRHFRGAWIIADAKSGARKCLWKQRMRRSIGIPVERSASTPATASTRAANLRGESGEIIGYVLKINAGSFSFEAANPRHEHEYHLFERVKVPEGKVIVPGVVTHASNIVEHPELFASG